MAHFVINRSFSGKKIENKIFQKITKIARAEQGEFILNNSAPSQFDSIEETCYVK